jgi:hypothetical protein
MQWPKEKERKDKQWSTKSYTENSRIEQHEPHMVFTQKLEGTSQHGTENLI